MHEFGEIECPHCREGMRVKSDKNGDPFGHCEHCSGQLRVGGKVDRVEKFFRSYPHLSRPGSGGSVMNAPVVDKSPKKAVSKQATAPVAAKKSGFSFFDQLNQVTP